MSMLLPNGPGELLGDQLATGVRLAVIENDTVLFVGPTNASDADTGTDPLRPLATIGQAVTNGVDDNIIVLMDGLSSGTNTVNKKLIFAAGGQNAGKPTVRWTGPSGGASINVSAADVEFRNIWFLAPSEANAAPRIVVTGADCLFRDCYFTLDGNDAGDGVISLGAGADRCRFERCTFVVTSTSVASRPPAAIYINSVAVTRLDIIDCTFDGGTTGHDTTGGTARTGTAVDCWFAGNGATRLRFENLTLLRGPDIRLGGPNSFGHVQIQTNTGGSKLVGL